MRADETAVSVLFAPLPRRIACNVTGGRRGQRRRCTSSEARSCRSSCVLLESCLGLVAATSCQESRVMSARGLMGALTRGLPYH